MRELSIDRMEMVNGGGWKEDIIVGLACGGTAIMAFTPAAPLAILTGNVCAVGLIGYAIGKY
jgi:hypothetical protein